VPQSLSNVLVHVVFSTKHRHPYLATPELRGKVAGYMVGILRNIHCPSLLIGDTEDHVHILCNLHRTIPIARLVEDVKPNSSIRIKEEGAALRDFHWQNGYGVFSVSQSNVEQVKAYIAAQEKHHRQRSFQDEFRLMPERHGIQYDERYVWD
jgi:REP element-mobilizing transposase RayT